MKALFTLRTSLIVYALTAFFTFFSISEAQAQCCYEAIISDGFESGWGNWVDGGADARKNINDAAFANTGSYCVRLQDNTGTSVISTGNLDLSGYVEITVDFSVISSNFSSTEDFWVQLSTNGGSSYSTVATYVQSVDFTNGVRSQLSATFTASFTSTSRLRFRCDASANADRIYLDDIVVTGDIGDITSYPYSESFESGLGCWTQDSGEDFDWTNQTGATSTPSTGPTTANDGSYYMYTEASGANNPSKVAILQGPCLDLTSLTDPGVTFDYHMYGDLMGTLNLQMSSDDGSSWSSIWSKSGDQTDNWYGATVDLSAVADSTIILRFKGTTGASQRSDMAIDNIVVDDVVINTKPVADDDADAAVNDETIQIDVLNGDTDADGDDLTISATMVSAPNHGGTAVVNDNGTGGDPTDDWIDFTPSGAWIGVETFEYEICDDGSPSKCDTALVTVTISANTSPVAVVDADTTTADVAINIDVLDNDSDVNAHQEITISSITVAPDQGATAVIDTNGTSDPSDDFIVFTPSGSYEGSETFTYQICDNGISSLCSTAVVTVYITPNTAPDAVADVAATPNDDITIDVLDNDSDPDVGQTITLDSITVAPDNGGSATINDNGTPANSADDFVDYSPEGSYVGVETFTYQICDDGSPQKCSTAVVSVTVSANTAPSAVADAEITDTNAITVDVLDNDSDTDGHTITLDSITVAPNHGGTAVINDNGTAGNPADDYIDYTPSGSFSGTETFTYQICDDGTPNLCATAVVTIDIVPLDTFTWNGSVDNDAYTEGNWSNGLNDIPTIDAATDLDYHLVINSGTPGGAGYTGNLQMNGKSLVVNGGTLTGDVNSGLKSDALNAYYVPLTMTGGTVDVKFFKNVNASLTGDAEVVLHGTGNPMNTSTIDLVTPFDGFVYFPGETVADCSSEHIPTKFTVNGDSAIIGTNIDVTDSSGFALVTTIEVDTFYWSANYNPVGVFQEGNWQNLGGTDIPQIDAGVELNAHLVVDFGTPGGTTGHIGDLKLGGNSLTVTAGTFTSNSSSGISSTISDTLISTLNISGGVVSTKFVKDIAVYMTNDAQLTVYGGGNPLNTSTIDISTCDSAVIYFTDELPAAVRVEHLSCITVSGNPAVENENIFLYADTLVGTYLTTYKVGASCDDGDDCTINDVVDTDCNCVGTAGTDTDGDGVCDLEDQCPGFDDTIDNDLNGIPDSCDVFCDLGTIDSFTYFQGWESGIGLWQQSVVDSFDWTVISGATPSSPNTGPSSAYEGSQYLYIEASSPNNPSKTAEIISPCFDLTGAPSPSFGFNYHMFGAASMGSLSVSVASEDNQNWTTLFSKSGNQTDNWYRGSVDLGSYEGKTVRIKFTAVTGATWQGDIAIDSLIIQLDCAEGASCSDNDLCTVDDQYNANCDCVGTEADDLDGDGLCDQIDPVPGYSDIYISSGSSDSIQLYRLNNDMSLDSVGDVETTYPYNSLAFNVVDGFMYGLQIDPPNNYYDIVQVSTNGIVDSLGRVTYEGSPITWDLRTRGAMDFNDKFYAFSDKGSATLGLDANADVIYEINVTTLAIDTFYDFGNTGYGISDFAYNLEDNKIYAITKSDASLMIFDLTTSTVEITDVDNLVSSGSPFGGAWFDAYGSFYILENTGPIYRIDSVAAESRVAEGRVEDERRADGWRATLVATTGNTDQNDATNGLSPIISNQVSPIITCGVSTLTKTYSVFNPYKDSITFDFTEDMRSVTDYADDTTDQSATPLDGTFLPATLSETHGGSASFSASDQFMTISGMTVPSASTITFTVQLTTPDLAEGNYFSQAQMSNMTSPSYTIAARASVSSDDFLDDFRAHPTSLEVNCSLLPVELIEFNVRESNGDAILDWSTASEVNNDYFVLERSVNASQWVEMARVEGHGTTNEQHEYTYTDKYIEKGRTYYYRLKQYDFDGTNDFSEIRHITILNEESASRAWGVFPNPVNRNEPLFIESSGCDDCKLRMYSATGNLIMETDIVDGTEAVDINQFNLPSGVYLIERSNRMMSERKKVIIQ